MDKTIGLNMSYLKKQMLLTMHNNVNGNITNNCELK